MQECANCKNKVEGERSNLFTQPLPLLITLYDEEGVSTTEKGEVSIYEALVDVFSLRSNINLMRLLESGMHAKSIGEENQENEKCLLALCPDCAYRLANLYELCQEFTQLSVKAHSFLYPIIAKVTVKAELLENEIAKVISDPDAEIQNILEGGDGDDGNGEGIELVGEFTGEDRGNILDLADENESRSQENHKRLNEGEENENEKLMKMKRNETPDLDDDQFYPLSPEANNGEGDEGNGDGDDDSDSEEGGVAGRVRRRMEKLAQRKLAGGDINALLEVTNSGANWLSSSDTEDDDDETSDESYVESEPEPNPRKKRMSGDPEKPTEGGDGETEGNRDDPDQSTTPKTPRRNRVKEKITCIKCGQQYVNKACYEKHMRRHKAKARKYRRIRKGPAKYSSIKEETFIAKREFGDGDDIPLEEQSNDGSAENNYPSDESGEEEEIIGGGRLRKRYRITDEDQDDDWRPKKRKGHRRSGPSAAHVEAEEKVRVPCTVCGNTFMSNGHLIQHMKTHTKPKNACILCGKEYRYPSELKVHLESHQRMKEKRLNAGKFKPGAPGENTDRLLNSDFSDDGEVPSPIPTTGTGDGELGESVEDQLGMENAEFNQSNPSMNESGTLGISSSEQKTEANEIVTCTVCRKHYRHPHFLQMHMQTHSKAIKCTQCPEVFTTPKDLREHKIAHRLERRATIEPMSCKYCGKQYYDETHLFRHQESHELPPPLFPCEICGKSFTRKQKLKLHIDTVHTTERPFRCHLCPLAYSRKDKLNAHITKAHGEELKCDLCGKSFIGEASLKVHRVKHAFEAPREFQCEQCGRKYQQLKHLKNHIKFMHRKRTANACQTCGKTFGRASCLKKHEISHQQIGSHLCSQCGKAYKHERSLILHEQKEHLGESSYQYECTICMKRFHRKELLQNHQVTENHMVQGVPQPTMIMPTASDLMREEPQLTLPEHFLQMPTPGISEMLSLPNPLDLIHVTTTTTSETEKYGNALSAISEASMFVAQNF